MPRISANYDPNLNVGAPTPQKPTTGTVTGATGAAPSPPPPNTPTDTVARGGPNAVVTTAYAGGAPPPARPDWARAGGRDTLGAPTPPPTDPPTGSQRYGNQLQQAGGTQRGEVELAAQAGPNGTGGTQGVGTVAYRVQVPAAAVRGQPTDLEVNANRTIGADPQITGAGVTVHNGPQGQAGTGVYLGVARAAQVKTDLTRDRDATGSNVASTWSFSPTVVKSIDGGQGQRLDLQAGGSATFGSGAQNAGRPAGAVYSGGAGFQMSQDLGRGVSVGAEGWVAGSVSNNGDTSARMGAGVGVSKSFGPVSTSLWVENQTEVGARGKVQNTPTVTAGISIPFR